MNVLACVIKFINDFYFPAFSLAGEVAGAKKRCNDDLQHEKCSNVLSSVDDKRQVQGSAATMICSRRGKLMFCSSKKGLQPMQGKGAAMFCSRKKVTKDWCKG